MQQRACNELSFAAAPFDMKSYEQLVAGYGRFRQGEWQTERARWAELKDGQAPEVMVIACSDSRVDPAQIFDAGPGEIFVVRNVAAMVPPFETTMGQHGVSAAVEFAVQFLGVREIVVMGHGACGGCKAALTRDLYGNALGEGGFVARWVSMLDDTRDRIVQTFGSEGTEAELQMELAAVRQSLSNLRTFPFVAEKEQSGDLMLHGAHFAIADGILRRLDSNGGAFTSAA